MKTYRPKIDRRYNYLINPLTGQLANQLRIIPLSHGQGPCTTGNGSLPFENL